MRAALAAAERAAEVRSAARSWSQSGLIDAPALERIEALYPVDRAALGPVWRVVVFLLVVIAVVALLAGAGMAFTNRTLLLIFSVLLVLATEIQQGPLRFSGVGSEAAASFLACVFSSLYVGLHGFGWFVTAVGVSALWGLACWRWGYWLYGLVAAAALILAALEAAGAPRLGVIAITALVALLAAPNLDRASLAPSLRRALLGALAVALAALYASVNRYSLDARLLETLAPRTVPIVPLSGLQAGASWLATVLLPAALLAWGIASRRRVLLDLSIVFVILSLLTLRFYFSVGPPWLVLATGGAVAVALALWIERVLARSPGREWSGITAAPLLDSGRREQALEMAATIALAPRAEAHPARDAERFRGGGGEFGGGGASGDF